MLAEENDKIEQNGNFIKIQDLWALFVSKWYWFAIFLFITIAIAITYIAITVPVYMRSTSVLIKDNSESSSSTAAAAGAFADMWLFKSNINVNNEILVFRAPELMEEVIQRLNLDYNYSIPNKFQKKVLYKDSPITIHLDQEDEYNSISFVVEMLSKQKVSISKFKLGKEHIAGDDIIGTLSSPIATPIGNICINPTPFYSEKYIGKSITFVKNPIKSLTRSYSSRLSVDLADEKSTVINISIEDVSTMRAEDILTTLVAVYNEEWVENKNMIAISTSNFINERLAVIEEELGGVDNDISSFKSKNLLPDVASVSSKYLLQSGENEKNILGLNTQLAMARYISKYMRDDTEMKKLLPANSGIENMNVENQISQYNELLLQRNNLLANSSDKNPVVRDMNKSLALMKEAIIRSIDDLIAILNIQIDKVSNSENKNLQKLASNPDQVKYLLSVERQQKVKEALYLFLLQKREENELTQAFVAYNTTVVNRPTGSPLPVAPRKAFILLAALLIGLTFPAIFLYIKDSMNTLVHSRQDLDLLSIPFAGEIPLIQDNKKRFSLRKRKEMSRRIVVAPKGRDVINEAFRILRTNIDFMKEKSQHGTVIMNTSINSGSGKTFVIANLAASMAIKGSKVIVIDADLRKAAFSVFVDFPKKGVSDYLNGSIKDISDVIVKDTLIKNLSILAVGTIPPNPSELLLNTRFAELIQKLRTEYDYIFLDCPPVEVVTDTAIIALQCDMTLFIVRANLLDKRLLPNIENIYNSKKYQNISIVLNGTEFPSRKYGYNRYLHSTYSYGEGYYNNN